MKRWIERRRADGRERRHAAPRGTGARGPGPAEIESVLECAVKDATPAVVLVRDTGDVFRARFSRLERSRVTLALERSSCGPAPRPLSVCCVTFAHDERAYVFLAPLWRVTGDADSEAGRLLSVGLPGQMATLDVGSARRIPIGVGVTLSIEIGTYDRRSWTPEAVDLSASGILLDFGAKKPPRLPVGALVEIALECEGVRAELTAAVRRREGSRLALSFMGPASGEPTAPTEELYAILSQLEARWLESHGA
jgi:hypothetical protein